LEQARIIAFREDGIVRGIHILRQGESLPMEKFRELRERFDQTLEDEMVSGEFVVDRGEVSPLLVKRARWNDLLVFGLSHPPGDQPLARLRSGLRTLIQASSRPLLAVPAVSPMNKALLAYDGSPKADEGLFLGAYMAANWGVELVVATAIDTEIDRPESLAKAKLYLQSRKIRGEFVHQVGEPGEVLIKSAQDHECDFIIMGGYGHRPLLEVVLGSTVDYVLRQYNNPVLICR
jgi:nucleotide-binding universal stress UspA family protein